MIKSGKLIFLITFFAMLIQSVFFFYDKPDELMAIPLLLILGGLGAFLLRKYSGAENVDFQVNIFLLAFSVRLLVGMIFYGWGLSEVLGDEDSSGYISGWQVAENWYKNGFDGFITDLSFILISEFEIHKLNPKPSVIRTNSSNRS